MGKVFFRGVAVTTNGEVPKKGEKAPEFLLTGPNMGITSLDDFGKVKKVINIFPSIDTEVCALSVKKFHDVLANDKSIVVLNVSKDLPFAQVRFCAVEELENIEVLSAFRGNFSEAYGAEMTSGPLAGLLSRTVIVLDEENTVTYVQQCEEITQEIDYDKVLESLGKFSSSTS
ncbi:Probable thiol peroxidase [Chlamydiales bacterium SCGC AB-751-O23]|jgi:thioredoxin-dependent peroxiredoxin|nr:Probable thiol peroxidase [Chlamydiales bacterium SCGC AB-751-O23]